MVRYLSACVLALTLLSLTGCGGSFSGVQAVAPAIQQEMSGAVTSSGEYTLFRGTGYIEGFDEHIEPLWTITLQQGQKVGFRWVVDEKHKFNETGAFHLVAFAGGEARDLGSFQKRDTKYVWSGSKGDVAGFFSSLQRGYHLEAVGIR